MARRKESSTRRPKPPASHPVRQWAACAAVALILVVLTFRLFALISEYAVNIFFSDQWDFNDATLFARHSLWQMFSWQHGPHRQGLGAVLAWVIEPLFHWNSRTESFVVGAIVAAATVVALLLKKQLYGRLSLSDVIIPLMLLTPLQFETLFITANLAHGPLPLLLILLYCMAWTSSDVSMRYPLVLVLGFLTTYTGFGLFLAPVTPIALGMDYWANRRRTRRGALVTLVAVTVSLASLASFFIGYKLSPASNCFSADVGSPIAYAWFADLMFAFFFGSLGLDAFPLMVGAGALIALLLSLVRSGAALWRPGESWTRHLVVTILIGYCLLFCAMTAYGRVCQGLASAQSSRYVIYLEAGLLGLYFHLLTLSRPVVRHALIAVLGIALLGTLSPRGELRNQMAVFRNVKQGWRACYLTLGDIGRCNRFTRIYPWAPEQTHLQEKLDFLKQTRQNLYASSD